MKGKKLLAGKAYSSGNCLSGFVLLFRHAANQNRLFLFPSSGTPFSSIHQVPKCPVNAANRKPLYS
jgi:hypothetical protein